MIFSSFTFLLLFMPCVLLLYRVMPAGLRMPFLLAASLFFYGFGTTRSRSGLPAFRGTRWRARSRRIR